MSDYEKILIFEMIIMMVSALAMGVIGLRWFLFLMSG